MIKMTDRNFQENKVIMREYHINRGTNFLKIRKIVPCIIKVLFARFPKAKYPHIFNVANGAYQIMFENWYLLRHNLKTGIL